MSEKSESPVEIPEGTPSPLVGLLDLWRSKAETATLPGRGAFDPQELKPWIGNLILLDVLENGRDFRYRLHGSNLVRLFGKDLTGRTVASLQRHYRDELVDEYRSVTEFGRPIVRIRERPIEKDFLSVCRLVLPLATDGRTVDKLLVYIDEMDRTGLDD